MVAGGAEFIQLFAQHSGDKFHLGQSLGFVLSFEDTVFQNRDSVRNLVHLVQKVCDEQDGQAVFSKLANDLEQLFHLSFVETGCRLVEDQNFGGVVEHPGDGDQFIKSLKIKTPNANTEVKRLSGGNQQKVLLARWLATDPTLLILDEPTRGIDVGAKVEIMELILNLSRKGMSVLFISAEFEEVLRCSNRIVVLKDKAKIAELAGADMNESNIMHAIAGGK